MKYKAKSWIDTFGARGSKALGSVVTNYYSYSATALVSNGSLVGIAVVVFLIYGMHGIWEMSLNDSQRTALLLEIMKRK